MKILSFEYYDKSTGWHLHKTDFSDLNLLVGVSGAGKTSILNAIDALTRIARGQSLNGVEWDVEFLDQDKNHYKWKGEFERTSPASEKGIFSKFYDIITETRNKVYERDAVASRILTEELFLNSKTIASRIEDLFTIEGKEYPKLSPFESIIKILNQDRNIRNAYLNIIKISSRDPLYNDGLPFLYKDLKFEPLIDQFKDINILKNSQLTLNLKLALAFYNFKTIFKKIKEQFQRIFPQVENIEYRMVPEYSFMPSFPEIIIKEYGVDHWISSENISSGMLRTLNHIADLYLLPDNSVVLIDEFENSLGINCINAITDDIQRTDMSTQFIITSHHPYIINNISKDHWKIVTRKGSEVTVRNAKDFPLGESNHEAFIQLINLEEFAEGIQ